MATEREKCKSCKSCGKQIIPRRKVDKGRGGDLSIAAPGYWEKIKLYKNEFKGGKIILKINGIGYLVYIDVDDLKR